MNISTDPAFGFNVPDKIPINVLFPLPLGPVKTTCSPFLISRFKLLKIGFQN